MAIAGSDGGVQEFDGDQYRIQIAVIGGERRQRTVWREWGAGEWGDLPSGDWRFRSQSKRWREVDDLDAEAKSWPA